MSTPAVIDPTPAPAVVVPLLNGVGYVVGHHVFAPMLSAALDAPDTQAAVRRTALVAGSIFGACILTAIAIGRRI